MLMLLRNFDNHFCCLFVGYVHNFPPELILSVYLLPAKTGVSAQNNVNGKRIGIENFIHSCYF